MEFIQIKDWKFKYFQPTTFNLEASKIIGITSKDAKLTEEMLFALAGINDKAPIYYNDKKVYDNEEYFQNRLYFDFKQTYLKTLNVDLVEQALNEYQLQLTRKGFKRDISFLQLRKGATFTNFYHFPSRNNTLVNFAIATNIEAKNLIINNPTFAIDDLDTCRIIIERLKELAKTRTIILGLNSLLGMIADIDSLIVISDYNQIIKVDKEDSLIVIEDNNKIKTKLCKCKQSNYVIALNDYQKDELKSFTKAKIDYKIITINGLINYL